MGGEGGGAGPDSGVGEGPIVGAGVGTTARLRRIRRMSPAATATAATPSIARAGGETSTSSRELGVATSSKRTAERTVAFWTFVQVAELAVVLLGGVVPDGTTTFTE